MGVWRVLKSPQEWAQIPACLRRRSDVTKVGPADRPFAPIPFTTEDIQGILEDPDWSD